MGFTKGGKAMDEARGEGWLTFAAIVLIFEGIMRIFDSIWAFRYHGAVPEGLQNALLGSTLKHYGWYFLIVGALLIFSGVAVLGRSQFARWIGITAAVIGGLSAVAWLPYYPVWSIIYIAIAIMVIYALAVYGSRAEPNSSETLNR
jgi:hypothetical protein